MGKEKGIKMEMYVAIAMKRIIRCRFVFLILIIANYSMQIIIISVGMVMERNSNHLAVYLARMTASANFKFIFNLCSISSSRTFTTPSFSPPSSQSLKVEIVALFST